MSVNRRAFLLSGGTAAAAVATGSFARSAKAQQVTPSPIYSSSATIAHLTTGNTIVQPNTAANNWVGFRNTLVNVANDWQTDGYDAKLASNYARLSPGVCKSSNLPQSQILSSVQAVYPSVTLQQLQTGWALLDNVASYRTQNMIYTLQTQGMIPYLTSAMQIAARFAASANGGVAPALASSTFRPTMLPPNYPPPQPRGGCAANVTFAVDMIGLAFVTISVMSGFGVIAEGLAWGVIATWGGGAATLYATGQHIFC